MHHRLQFAGTCEAIVSSLPDPVGRPRPAACWIALPNVLFPGMAITVTVLAFKLLGDGIRDMLNPSLRGAV